VAVDLRSARTNYCVPAIQRIGSTDAWRERRTAANGLRGQTRTVVERQVAVQSPVILDKSAISESVALKRPGP